MNAGINYQSHRAEKLVTQTPEVSKRVVVVPPRLFCQPLAVKRPGFHVRSKRNYFPKLRNAFEFLCCGDLPMMSWYAFVIRQCRHAPFGHLVHVAEVREENPRPGAIHRRRLIVCPWRGRLLELRDLTYHSHCARGGQNSLSPRRRRCLRDQLRVSSQC